jgi:folate-binding protein YgfZ
MPDLTITPLDDLAVLAVRGPDAVQFLQGQLSQDMKLLDERTTLLAGLHNPQGRCLAVLRLFQLDGNQILVVLPAELADGITTHLAKYLLRARVRIENASAQWRVFGATGPDAAATASTRLHMSMDATGVRQMIVAPRGEALPEGGVATRESWRLEDIKAGLPEVLSATSGSFVAQMLNLDVLDGISFTKGCYTGQEVIARAHYRGQVKRRMQRFVTDSALSLQPGERYRLHDGRMAQIVVSAPGEPGRQQFLAVTALTSSAAGNAEPAGTNGNAQEMTLHVAQLSLPYALPA